MCIVTNLIRPNRPSRRKQRLMDLVFFAIVGVLGLGAYSLFGGSEDPAPGGTGFSVAPTGPSGPSVAPSKAVLKATVDAAAVFMEQGSTEAAQAVVDRLQADTGCVAAIATQNVADPRLQRQLRREAHELGYEFVAFSDPITLADDTKFILGMALDCP